MRLQRHVLPAVWGLLMFGCGSGDPPVVPAPAEDVPDVVVVDDIVVVDTAHQSDPGPPPIDTPPSEDSSPPEDVPDVPPADVSLPEATWTLGEPMPAPRVAAGGALNSGRVYLVGGVGFDDVAVYDLLGQTWDVGAPMSANRHDLGVAAVNGQVYAAGGRSDNDTGYTSLSSVERYNPGADAWKTMLSLPDAGCCGAAVGVDPSVYLFGGRDGAALVHSFDPAVGVWLEHSPMPVGRSRHCAALLENRVVLIGGLEADDAPAPIHQQVDVYDTLSDVWVAAPEAPFQRYDTAAAVGGGLVWVFGGRDAAGQPTDSVWVLDVDLGWTAAPPMPRLRASHAAIAVLDGILLLGGEPESTAMDRLTL